MEQDNSTDTSVDTAKGQELTENPQRSEKEVAEYNFKRQAERVRAAGLDPAQLLGVNAKIDSAIGDDEPLTIGKLRELQRKEAQKTSIEMAEELPEGEREDVVELLTNRIVPSGNAVNDLELARAAASAEHNAKIARMAADRPEARRTASGGSQSAPVEQEFTPTEEEARHMRVFKITKEQVIAARRAHEENTRR